MWVGDEYPRFCALSGRPPFCKTGRGAEPHFLKWAEKKAFSNPPALNSNNNRESGFVSWHRADSTKRCSRVPSVASRSAAFSRRGLRGAEGTAPRGAPGCGGCAGRIRGQLPPRSLPCQRCRLRAAGSRSGRGLRGGAERGRPPPPPTPPAPAAAARRRQRHPLPRPGRKEGREGRRRGVRVCEVGETPPGSLGGLGGVRAFFCFFFSPPPKPRSSR